MRLRQRGLCRPRFGNEERPIEKPDNEGETISSAYRRAVRLLSHSHVWTTRSRPSSNPVTGSGPKHREKREAFRMCQRRAHERGLGGLPGPSRGRAASTSDLLGKGGTSVRHGRDEGLEPTGVEITQERVGWVHMGLDLCPPAAQASLYSLLVKGAVE